MKFKGFKTVLTIITIIAFVFMPYTTSAQEIEDGRAVGLNKGDTAPFGGVLLDGVAIGKILAAKERCEEECEIEKDELKERHQLKIKKLEETLAAEMAAELAKKDVMIDARERDIALLEETLVEESDDDIWWAVGGLGLGVALTALITVPIIATQ